MARIGWYPHKGWPDRPHLSPVKHPQLHSGSTAWASQVQGTPDSIQSHECHGVTHPRLCLSPLPLWPREDISREANTSSTNLGQAALKPHACPTLHMLQMKVTREFAKIIKIFALRIEAGTVEASNPHPFCVVVVVIAHTDLKITLISGRGGPCLYSQHEGGKGNLRVTRQPGL